MKGRRNELKRPSRKIRIAVMLAVFAAAVTGLVLGIGKLRSIWLVQCVLEDPDRQIEVITGKMAKRGQILELFGLRKGVNLAEIEFDRIRQMARTNATYAMIREIAITRIQPNRLRIAVAEREPLVKVCSKGVTDRQGRVADAEGVIFRCLRGTEALPTIRESPTVPTRPGQQLKANAYAALKLLEVSADAEYQSLGITDADASHPDFILVTLGNYSRAKIAWEDMSDGRGGNRSDMLLRLSRLQQAIAANLATGMVLWNATLPDRVFADTKEPFL